MCLTAKTPKAAAWAFDSITDLLAGKTSWRAVLRRLTREQQMRVLGLDHLNPNPTEKT